MRIRKKPWAEPELAVCDFFVKEPRNYRGKWAEQFTKRQPLHLELGCGKCGFAGQMAFLNPDINFMAVDIKSDMLGVGRRNIVNIFQNSDREIDNLLLIEQNIEQIDMLIAPEDKIERIYINFCNPWPRGKHNKRRLTFPKKLRMYRSFLVDGGEIRFKTDDDELFDDSIEYFKSSGFEITYLTFDLHNSDFTENIMTEHEKMFSAEGKKIKFLIAK